MHLPHHSYHQIKNSKNNILARKLLSLKNNATNSDENMSKVYEILKNDNSEDIEMVFMYITECFGGNISIIKDIAKFMEILNFIVYSNKIMCNLPTLTQ